MRPKTILVFGRGQLGTFYQNYFAEKKIKVSSPKSDICDQKQVNHAIQELKPDLVINVAAKTNIDWCELNQLETFSINTLGADNIAKSCQEQGIYLVHLSSGCVQESKSAHEIHTEEDQVHPLCFYSWTKVWAEELLLDRMKFYGLKTLILRPRQLLSSIVSPRNAITKMLTYTKFIDTANSCTIVEDLMEITHQLIKKDATGVINVVNSGVITPFQIAQMIKEIIKPDMRVTKISKEELNQMTLAKRIDCVLSTQKLSSLGLHLAEITPRLRQILTIFKENLKKEEAKSALKKTAMETETKLRLKKKILI